MRICFWAGSPTFIDIAMIRGFPFKTSLFVGGRSRIASQTLQRLHRQSDRLK
jgi:hypothetical protein